MKVKEGTMIKCMVPTRNNLTRGKQYKVLHCSTFTERVIIVADDGRMQSAHLKNYKIMYRS